MRLLILFIFLVVLSFASFSQQETITGLFSTEEIELHTETPEKSNLIEKQDIECINSDVVSNGVHTYTTKEEDEELSDSDQGMSGVIRAVGVACATFVGCIAGVGVTIWLCIKGKKAIQSASN